MNSSKNRSHRAHVDPRAVWLAAVVLAVAPPAIAAQYVYTPTTSTTDSWSVGTDWSATPISASTTELTFADTTGSTVFANGLANSNTDDIAGQFLLNILDLGGIGPATGAAQISINSASPSDVLAFSFSNGISPVINLTGMAGAAGLTYTINAPVGAQATFQGNGTAAFNFAGPISGDSGSPLTKAGLSTMTISGAESYTGGTTILGGTLRETQSSGSPFGSGLVEFVGGTLAINPAGSGANVALSAPGGWNVVGGDTLALNQGSNTSLTLSICANGPLQVASGGALIISESAAGRLGSVTPGSSERVIVAGTAPAGNSLNSFLLGAPAVVQHPDGTADFLTYDHTNGFESAAQFYTPLADGGNPTVDEIANVPTSATLATTTNNFTIAGLRIAANQTLTGSSGASAHMLSIGNNINAFAPILLNSNANIASNTNFTLNLGQSSAAIYVGAGTSTISPPLIGGSVIKYGPGTLVLSGNVSGLGGEYIIDGGTVSVAGNSNFGSGTAVQFNGGTLLTTQSFSISKSFSFNGAGGTINVAGGTTLTQANLTDGGSLTKSGTGTLSLTSNAGNSMTLAISQGQVEANEGSAASSQELGTGPVTIGDTNTGANNISLFCDSSVTTNVNLNNPIIVTPNGTGTVTIGTSIASGEVVTFAGALTLGRPTTLQSSGDTAGSSTSFTGQISGNVGTLTFGGGSTNNRVVLGNPANNFTGNVVVNPSTILQLGSNTAIPATADVTINGTVWFAAPTGGTFNFGAINGAATGLVAESAAVNAGAVTLDVGDTNHDGSFGGLISNVNGGGSATTVVSLTKLGSGTQSLSGSNTYSGTTTVSAGTLLAANASNGSATGSGPVNVSNGAKLGGSGTIDGFVSFASGGQLAPSAGVPNGTTILNLDDGLSLAGGSILDMDISASHGSDLVSVIGNLSLGAGGTLNLDAFAGPLPVGQYELIQFTGSESGSAANWTVAGISDPSHIDRFSIVEGHQFDLTVTAVPEPSSLVLLGVGGMVLAGLAIRCRSTSGAGQGNR